MKVKYFIKTSTDKNNITFEFPDLNISIKGNNLSDVITKTRESLTNYVKNNKKNLPKPEYKDIICMEVIL